MVAVAIARRATARRATRAALAVRHKRIVIVAARAAPATSGRKTGETQKSGKNECVSRHGRSPDWRFLHASTSACARTERCYTNDRIGQLPAGSSEKLKKLCRL